MRHPVLGDRADERREDGVVERLAVATADEVGAEPFEEVVQRPDARPLPHRVREGDELEEHVRDEDVVGVGAVVDDVDDGGVARRGLVEVAQPLALDDGAIEEVHDRARDRRAEAVVREEVELRDDLAQVGPGLLRGLLDGDVVRLRVLAHGLDDVARAEHLELDEGVPPLELEAVDMDLPLALQPPGVALPQDRRDDDDGEERGGGDRVAHHCTPNSSATWRAMAGTSFTSSAVPRVKTTTTSFFPPGVSTYAASWRTSLVQPAFDQSFAVGGSASPMNSLTWFSPSRVGFSGRSSSAIIAALASFETDRPRTIQRRSAATAFALLRLRFTLLSPRTWVSRPNGPKLHGFDMALMS